MTRQNYSWQVRRASLAGPLHLQMRCSGSQWSVNGGRMVVGTWRHSHAEQCNGWAGPHLAGGLQVQHTAAVGWVAQACW